MATKQLWALDFDGVVCDSCGESALSAWRAAEGLWPDMFAQDAVKTQKDDIMEKMRAVRPVVETGAHSSAVANCVPCSADQGASLHDKG